MPEIANVVVEILPVEGRRHVRLVRVDYDLVTRPDDAFIGQWLDERVSLCAVDLHDAIYPPHELWLKIAEARVPVAVGVERREHGRSIAKADLDVEADLWRTGLGGETLPIAEFKDHLVASVALRDGDQIVAFAQSEILTGSWGVLGVD